jgi:hypothetical protein
MKYKLAIIALVIASTTACKNKTEAISRSQMKAKTDSLVAVKMQEINAQAMEDLDRRMSIEVKAKTDSLVMLCTGQTKRDSIIRPAGEP